MSDQLTEVNGAGRVCCDCGVWKSASEFYRKGAKLISYCKPCWKVRNKEKYERNAEKYRAWMRAYREELKLQVIEGYGGACACCGESDHRFLTVDHINNDGKEHRKRLGVSGGPVMHRDIINRGFPKDIRVLCFNCNCARSIYGDCPHSLTP